MEFRFHHLLSYSTLLLLFAAIPSFAQSDSAPRVAWYARCSEVKTRLLTRWHERNAFILTSLLGVVEPGDRVLVLYGAGHQTLLRRFIADDPTLKLRTLDELVVANK